MAQKRKIDSESALPRSDPITCLNAALLSALAWTALTVPSLTAQSDGNAPLLLELPASTRALGMGNAPVLVGRDPDALFIQPGIMNEARGSGVAIQRYGSEGILGSVSTAREWSSGRLLFGLQILTYGVDSAHVAAVPDNARDLLTSKPEGAAEFVGSIGYGREILGFRLGIAAKFIDQRLGGLRDATGAVDLGIVKEVAGITLGLAALNIGPGIAIAGSDRPLPHRVTFGASLGSEQIGPLDVVATAAVSRLRDGDVIPAGGIEVSYWPLVGRTFTARLGARRVPDDGTSPVTFGAAFTGDNITIEYAFEGFDAPGSAHRIGLRWR